MQAMILAAGRGERLRPITETIPKPLIEVGNSMLIEYHLQNLARSDFTNIVINVSYLSELIEEKIGDGRQYGLNIHYSVELGGPYGTAAGIANAMPLFVEDQIIVVNGDIFTDFDFDELTLPENSLAHLVLVPNPRHNSSGDFALQNGNVKNKSLTDKDTWTFSGIGCYEKSIFENLQPSQTELGPVLNQLIEQGRVTTQTHTSMWVDVGTVERLELARSLANDARP